MKGGQRGPAIPPVSPTVDPGRDFYRHVNAAWHSHTSIPRYAGSYGVSEEIERIVQEELLQLIHGLPTSHPLSLLSKSVLQKGVQKNNIKDLQRFLNSFDCMRDSEDVARKIGELNRIQSRSPLIFTVAPDTFRSTVCRVYIYEPMLGLPSKHYYEGSQRILLHYGSLLKKLGTAFDIRDLEKVVSIEQKIIPVLTEGTGSPSESYESKSIVEMEREWKAIPWRTLLLAWGMPTDLIRSSTFVITNTHYVDLVNKLFNSYDLPTWRIWLQSYAVLSFMEYLPAPFDNWHFGLYGHLLRGNTQKSPQYLVMLRVLQTMATQSLSFAYVQQYIPESIKTEATSMVHRLKTATANRIRSLPWMVPATKKIAIEKVRSMRFRVAYASEWYDEFAGITVDPERLLQNIWNLNKNDTVRMIDTLGEGCGNPGGKWEDGAFEVNAYYYPDRNQLVIPAGMLRSPFFDLKRSVAWNYGGIGAAIGHEITHAFDEEGKNYDVHGSYKEWWTATDNKQYIEMTHALIDLFDGQEYEGGKVDGTLTLSENIADLGGISIALSALQDYLHEKKTSPAGKKKAYKDFFISYAVSWRNKDRPQKAKQALFMDVHAPAHLRVNLIVRQFKEFYEAFEIAEGDPGWIPEGERIRLW